MIYFNNDYSEGCHPKILEALARTNLEQTFGYGEDEYCARAAEKIRTLCGREDAAVLCRLAIDAARYFPDADIEIVEAHHNRKVDAPSGTALMLLGAIKEVRPNAWANCGRSGEGKRTKEEIGISALRMGSVVGMHEVILHTGTQQLTLRHEAVTRAMLADGAVDAARFLLGKPAGLYNMESILNQ